MTDTERERLAGLADVEEIKVYQAKSRVRRRIEEELTFDVEILAENHPELLDELRAVVCEKADSGKTQTEQAAVQGSVDTSLKDERVESAAERPATEDTAEEIVDELEDEDPIEEALKGWSYGRTDEEQAANHTVARQSLEWLRDEGGDEVRQSDIPLEEFAEEDPEGRKSDTIWRSVVRGAWQHATGLGYIEMPDSRAYTWSGK